MVDSADQARAIAALAGAALRLVNETAAASLIAAADRGETRGPAVPVLSTRGYWEVGVSADGDLVTIENQYAKAKATARLTQRIHPDVVGMTHGFGHWGLGPVAKGKGVNDSQFLCYRLTIVFGHSLGI